MLRKFNLDCDIKKFLIQKAFIKKEEWMPESLVSEIQKAIDKTGVDIIGGEDFSEWFYNKNEWHMVFRGDSKIELEAAKEKGITDEDELGDAGQVFVNFYIRLKDGKIYKMETETVN